MPISNPSFSDILARCQLPKDQAHSLPPVYYTPNGHLDVEAQAVFSGWVGLGRADIPALVNQQRSLASPAARPGRFQPLLEPNVARFASWYAGRMMGTE